MKSQRPLTAASLRPGRAPVESGPAHRPAIDAVGVGGAGKLLFMSPCPPTNRFLFFRLSLFCPQDEIITAADGRLAPSRPRAG